MLSIYAISTEYVTVPIYNTSGVNLTTQSVSFAFLGPYQNSSQAIEAVPTSATTWYTGSWGLSTTSPFTAFCLVGPSGGVVTLASGVFLLVIKVSDSPETPVLFSGPMAVS